MQDMVDVFGSGKAGECTAGYPCKTHLTLKFRKISCAHITQSPNLFEILHKKLGQLKRMLWRNEISLNLGFRWVWDDGYPPLHILHRLWIIITTWYWIHNSGGVLNDRISSSNYENSLRQMSFMRVIVTLPESRIVFWQHSARNYLCRRINKFELIFDHLTDRSLGLAYMGVGGSFTEARKTLCPQRRFKHFIIKWF